MNDFSILVHNFLDSIRSGTIAENRKKEFFDFIQKLDKGTEVQKRRFTMFYSFKSIQEIETFSTIAEKEHCTYSAIKYSVTRFISILVNLKNEEQKFLNKIIENTEI